MVRQFFYAAFADPYWRAMMKSTDATLAAIAAKAEKEMAYHLRHASEWVIRLGDGTEESHRRAQAALDELWPYTGEMFRGRRSERALIDAGIAVDPATSARRMARRRCPMSCSEATLALPENGWMQRAAAAAGTASISAICSPSCNSCSAPFRGPHGDAPCSTMPSCGSAPGTRRRRWSIPRFRC